MRRAGLHPCAALLLFRRLGSLKDMTGGIKMAGELMGSEKLVLESLRAGIPVEKIVEELGRQFGINAREAFKLIDIVRSDWGLAAE
jgi:hypothetical protein